MEHVCLQEIGGVTFVLFVGTRDFCSESGGRDHPLSSPWFTLCILVKYELQRLSQMKTQQQTSGDQRSLRAPGDGESSEQDFFFYDNPSNSWRDIQRRRAPPGSGFDTADVCWLLSLDVMFAMWAILVGNDVWAPIRNRERLISAAEIQDESEELWSQLNLSHMEKM
ncbi:unnamed protein product [Pleuronectes platessa]|uniref:Uncharacterized protein n=1 Tax=Pleuronectes platessa TaxID=8262 RepID=A0A9N7VU22_PLEPL|nr:unnamed protein product [Pleuronectes platessa]